MPPGGFEPTISVGERPPDLRLRPRGHWDRLFGRLPVDFIGDNIPLSSNQYDKFI